MNVMCSATDGVLVAAAVEETGREDILDVMRCRESVMEALEMSGFTAIPLDVGHEDMQAPSSLAKTILRENPCCVFNLFEGFSKAAFMEASFARLLESLGTPFTGSGSMALAGCLDKQVTRLKLRGAGLPVPPGTCVRSLEETRCLERLSFPVFVKPCREDSSVGIDAHSVVRDRSRLQPVLARSLAEFPEGVMVEEYLPGREFNAGCMGLPPYEFLAISCIRYKPEKGTSDFLGYDSKWRPGSIDFREIESRVETAVSGRLRLTVGDMCRRAGKTMGCEGYFRVDFRERDGRLYVLEVNPNPDINTDSGFARQCAAAGYSYPAMVSRLVELAVERGERRVQKDTCPTRRVAVR